MLVCMGFIHSLLQETLHGSSLLHTYLNEMSSVFTSELIMNTDMCFTLQFSVEH